jgi:hypothetical protein
MTDPDERQAKEITRRKTRKKRLHHRGSVSEQSAGLYLGALRMILFVLVVAAALWAAKYGIETYIGHPINWHDATLAPVPVVR